MASLADLPTEVLLQAYATQRNPFALENRHAAAAQQAGEELRRRGIDLSGVRSQNTGGRVLKNTGLKSVGKAVGGVLKKVAPAAALIPGVGPVAAGLLAAGGSAAGQALSGDRVNLGQALTSGALGAGGAALLGGQGLSGLGSVGSRLGALPSGGQAGTGLLGILGKNPERTARIGLGVVGALQASQAAGRQRQLEDQALQQNPIFGGEVGAYSGNPYSGTSTNPYDQARRMRGQQSLAAQLSR